MNQRKPRNRRKDGGRFTTRRGYNTRLRLAGELSHEECATVLVALRYWQEHRDRGGHVPTHFDHFEDGTRELTSAEIDALAERINLQPIRTPVRFFLVRIVGDIEPQLMGPFSWQERLKKARRFRKDDPELKHGLFKLAVGASGSVCVESFTNGELGQ